MQWPTSITNRIQEETHFGNRVLNCFAERPANLNVMFAEALQHNGHGDAVVSDAVRLSYTELDKQVSATAAGLRKYGIVAGCRVAMLIGNRPEFLIVLLATLRTGAIAVPVNIREQTPELTYILNHCGASLLIHDLEVENRLPEASAVGLLKHRFSIGGATTLAKDYADLAIAADPIAAECGAIVELDATVDADEEDVAVILYTSGTTGLPKGAMLTHFNIVHSCMHYEYCMVLGKGERSLLAVPASHVTGVVAVFLTMVRVAGTSVILDSFDATEALKAASRERITHTIMVPAMYNLLLLRCNTDDYDLSAWRIGGFGGAPMPVPTIKALSKKLPDLLLINIYGATESASPATVLPLATAGTHVDSVGIAAPCANIRVVDDKGCDVADGEHGELWIGGPMIVPGYWNNPEMTQSEFDSGYWKSGDIASCDQHGYFRLHDRRKDMIIRGGYNIYSVEVENVVVAIDGVVECAAIGRPDSVLGEKIEVIVFTEKTELTSDEIVTYCRGHLADYKIPDFVTLLSEPLPRNANGKVLKNELRAR